MMVEKVFEKGCYTVRYTQENERGMTRYEIPKPLKATQLLSELKKMLHDEFGSSAQILSLIPPDGIN